MSGVQNVDTRRLVWGGYRWGTRWGGCGQGALRVGCGARAPGVGAAHAKKGRPYAGRPFLGRGCGSATVAEGRGDRTDGGLLLDVVHPLVVTNVSLRGAGEAKNRGGEATGDDGSKSELLHFDAFFFVFPYRPVWSFVPI